MAKKKLNAEDFTRFTTPVPTTPGGSSGLIQRARLSEEAQEEDTGAVVGEYPLAQILPDPFQGRGGLLPLELQVPVYNGEMTPGEALERWISDLDESSLYWPRYQALRELADSIRQEGLINPIHIYRPPEQFGVYRLESGERRYWACWLLEREHPGQYARVKAIVESGFSLGRQIDENEDVSALSPVGQARNVARAYLNSLGIFPAAVQPVTARTLYDYYHQAALPVSDLIGQGRLPDGFWENIERLLKKNRVSILERLAVFGLPRPALELADAAALNFYQIKEILSVQDGGLREELVRLAVGFDLTGSDLRKLAELAKSNPLAYNKAVRDLKSDRAAVPEVAARRKQGTPVEVQARRLVQAVRGIERIGDEEYRAVAHKILQERPKEAKAIAATLEKIVAALREGNVPEF